MSLSALFTKLHSDFHILYIIELHGKAVVTQTSTVFLICQSNDDVHLLLIDVTDTRNDSI